MVLDKFPHLKKKLPMTVAEQETTSRNQMTQDQTTKEADALVTPRIYTSSEPMEGEHPASGTTTEARTKETATTEEERKIIIMLSDRNDIIGIKASHRSVDQKKH